MVSPTLQAHNYHLPITWNCGDPGGTLCWNFPILRNSSEGSNRYLWWELQTETYAAVVFDLSGDRPWKQTKVASNTRITMNLVALRIFEGKNLSCHDFKICCWSIAKTCLSPTWALRFVRMEVCTSYEMCWGWEECVCALTPKHGAGAGVMLVLWMEQALHSLRVLDAKRCISLAELEYSILTVCSWSSFTNKSGFVLLEAVQLKLKRVFDGFYGKWPGLVWTPALLGKLVWPEELRLAP